MSIAELLSREMAFSHLAFDLSEMCQFFVVYTEVSSASMSIFRIYEPV